MVFPLCFATLTTCLCPPSWVLIKCQNVIAVERLMHCVTMMMPATAEVVMAGRLVFEAGSKFGLLCSAAASTACCSATSCCCSPSSSTFLPQTTSSQSRQVASGAGCCSRPEHSSVKEPFSPGRAAEGGRPSLAPGEEWLLRISPPQNGGIGGTMAL